MIKLRPLKKSDILSAAKIIGENYSAAYQRSSTKEMRAMFEPGVVKPYYLVAEENKKIIGFGGYMQSWMDYEIYTLFWLNVQKKYQGNGVGTKIVKKLIQLIKRKNPVFILLSTDRPGFYTRFGFKKLRYFKSNGYTVMGLTIKKKDK